MVFGLFATKTAYDPKASAEKFKKTVVSLAVDSTHEATFDLNNPLHLRKISECTAAVNQYLPVLRNCDMHIAIGFGVAFAALSLSAVIPFGLLIAMTGVAYGAYFLGGRHEPYNNFNAALEELAHCCDWALSDATNSAKFKNDDIKAMLKTLASHVTKEDLVTIMDSEDEANKVITAIADLNAQELQDHNEANPDTIDIETGATLIAKIATRNDVSYHLYGYKQGGSLITLANVVGLYFQKGFTYLWDLVTGAKNTPPNATPSIGM